MNNPYPWLDKPVEKWSYRDLKRECARFGYPTDEIDKYLNADNCNETTDPVEFQRRLDVFNYVLSFDYNRLGTQLYYEHKLKSFKKGGYLYKQRFRGRTRMWLRTLLRVIGYRFVDLFH